MLFQTNVDPRDHSTCTVSYDEVEGWLRATWQGYVDPTEALAGAELYLRYAAHTPCGLLLNDNTRLQGPWFDSLSWLARVWVPEATRLGLRYVAHVVQTDQAFDILSTRMVRAAPFEVQIFQDLADAQYWLRECRATASPGGAQLI